MSTEFFKQVKDYARKAADELGVPTEYIMAHWGHETGFRVRDNYNLAGIHAYPGSPYGQGGEDFPSLDDFKNKYVEVLKSPRYRKALKAGNVEEFARELRKGGYATDPAYEKSQNWDYGVKKAREVLSQDDNNNSQENETEVRGWFGTATEYWKNILGGDRDEAEETIREYQDEIDAPSEERMKEEGDHIKDIPKYVMDRLQGDSDLTLKQQIFRFGVIFLMLVVIIVFIIMMLPKPTDLAQNAAAGAIKGATSNE